MRYRLHIWNSYSTNETLSNDTKVNDLVTLTLILKIANLDLTPLLQLGAFVFHEHISFIYFLFRCLA